MTYLIHFKERPIKIGQGFNQGTHRKWPEDREDFTYSTDFLLRQGTKIIAAREGVVTKVKINGDKNYAGKNPLHGEEYYKDHMNEVEIKHSDGTFSCYAHLKYRSVKVKVGQYAKQGQPIALSGNTGWSSQPHLDFSVYNRNVQNWKIKSIKFKFTNYLKKL